MIQLHIALKIIFGYDDSDSDTLHTRYKKLEVVSQSIGYGKYLKFDKFGGNVFCEGLSKKQAKELLQKHREEIKQRCQQLLLAHTQIRQIERGLKGDDGYWEKVEVVLLVENTNEINL